MVLILVAPHDGKDKATHITLAWSKKLLSWLQKYHANIEIIALLGKDAVRHKVEGCLNSLQGTTGLFIYLDHGMRTAFMGSDDHPILDMENVKLLTNKFVYAVACYSAAHLGHAAVHEGALGFLGYNDTVQLRTGADNLFYDCLVFSGLEELFKQGTASTLRMRIIERIEYWIDIIAKMQMPPEEKLAWLPTIAMLSHNQDYLVHLGDSKWSWPGLPAST